VNVINEFYCILLEYGCHANPNDILILKYLLEENADIEAKSMIGWTVLHFAAESNSVDILRFLVEEKNAGILKLNTIATVYHTTNKVMWTW
jgi:ankyrin repeat protein